MRKNSTIIFLKAILLLVACKGYSQEKLRRYEYYENFIQKNKISACPLYFFDSVGYFQFMYGELPKNLKSIIYGYFLADSVLIRPPVLRTKAPNCVTGIISEINGFAKIKSDSSSFEKNNLVFSSHLLCMQDEPRKINNVNDEIRIVLFYSRSLGSKFKKLYQQAIALCNTTRYKLIIISLDPVYELGT